MLFPSITSVLSCALPLEIQINFICVCGATFFEYKSKRKSAPQVADEPRQALSLFFGTGPALELDEIAIVKSLLRRLVATPRRGQQHASSSIYHDICEGRVVADPISSLLPFACIL